MPPKLHKFGPYIVVAYDSYYPVGGLHDIESYDSYEDAARAVESNSSELKSVWKLVLGHLELYWTNQPGATVPMGR